MAELYSIYKSKIPKQVYINSVNAILEEVKEDLIKQQLKEIVCQVKESDCDYVYLWEGICNHKTATLKDIVELPSIYYSHYPKIFFKYLDYGIKLENDKTPNKVQSKYNEINLQAQAQAKQEKINAINYETKLYNFFNENISDNNRIEAEDEVGNKIVTFFVIDDVAISFVFNNNNDLIACTNVY